MESSLQNNIQPQQPAKKPTNPLLIIGIVYGLVVISLVTEIVVILATRNNSGSGGYTSTSNSNVDNSVSRSSKHNDNNGDGEGGDAPVNGGSNNSSDGGGSTSTSGAGPTSELVKSTCEKHNGTLESDDSVDDEDFEDLYYCQFQDQTLFMIAFVKEDKVNSYFESFKSTHNSGGTVLKNTNDFILFKSDREYGDIIDDIDIPVWYYATYKNANIGILTLEDDSSVEGLLLELGFPE